MNGLNFVINVKEHILEMKSRLNRLLYKIGYSFEYIYHSDFSTKTLIFYKAKLDEQKKYYRLTPIFKLWTIKRKSN